MEDDYALPHWLSNYITWLSINKRDFRANIISGMLARILTFNQALDLQNIFESFTETEQLDFLDNLLTRGHVEILEFLKAFANTEAAKQKQFVEEMLSPWLRELKHSHVDALEQWMIDIMDIIDWRDAEFLTQLTKYEQVGLSAFESTRSNHPLVNTVFFSDDVKRHSEYVSHTIKSEDVLVQYFGDSGRVYSLKSYDDIPLAIMLDNKIISSITQGISYKALKIDLPFYLFSSQELLNTSSYTVFDSFLISKILQEFKDSSLLITYSTKLDKERQNCTKKLFTRDFGIGSGSFSHKVRIPTVQSPVGISTILGKMRDYRAHKDGHTDALPRVLDRSGHKRISIFACSTMQESY